MKMDIVSHAFLGLEEEAELVTDRATKACFVGTLSYGTGSENLMQWCT